MPSCAEGGVLGVLPGIMGSIQAAEAIDLVLGKGTPLIGRLMLFDALDMKFKEVKLRKDPNCSVCGANPTVTKLIDYEAFCGFKEERRELELGSEISAPALKQVLDRAGVADLGQPAIGLEAQVFALDVHVALVLQALQRHGQMDPHGANLGGGTRRRPPAESLQ